MLVLIRPRGVSEGAVALSGACLVIAVGGLPLSSVLQTLHELIGVTAFLVGLFWMTLACERAGLFDRASDFAIRASGGSGRRFLLAVFVLGTATTSILSNDATVVLVTPVVLHACLRRGFSPLPYLFACTFVADTASSMLPVSNPINLLYAERFDIGFIDHAKYLIVPTLVAVTINWLVFHLLFRSEMRSSFSPPEDAVIRVTSSTADRAVLGGLLLIVAGYIASGLVSIGPYWITLAGGIALAAMSVASRRSTIRDVVRVQPPSLYAFIAGLALLVAAVERAGFLQFLGEAALWASESSSLWGLLATVAGTALGTNIVNNWTMALAVTPALAQANASDLLVLGSMLGADIGPNLSVVGSLATLIWMTQVRTAGLAVSARTYLKVGIIVTVPSLIGSTFALYGVYRLLAP